MSNFSFNKNPPDWKNDNINEELKNFCKLYENRPIKKNIGGMMFNHAFAIYFILKKTKPDLVIESGVYKGQSTWLIENTVPNAEIICLDIDLSKRVYISKKAKYSNLDFKFHDFSKIPKNTLVLFDDHINHMERIKEALFFKIKHVILEDNYSSNSGDFQTIKQCYEQKSFNHKLNILSIMKTLYLFIKILLKKKFIKRYNACNDLYLTKNRIRDHQFYFNEFNNLDKIIKSYYEFPSLKNIDFDLKKYETELKFYNNIAYVELI